MYNAVDNFDPMMIAPQPASSRDNRASAREDIAGPSFDDHMRQDAVRAAPDSERSEVQSSDENHEAPAKDQAKETQNQQQTQTAQNEPEPENVSGAASNTKPSAPQDCAYLVQTLAEAAPTPETGADKAEVAHSEKHSKTGKTEAAPEPALALTANQAPQAAPIEAPCAAQAAIVRIDTETSSSDQRDEPPADDAELMATKSVTPDAPPLPLVAPRIEATVPAHAKVGTSSPIDAEAARGAAEPGTPAPTPGAASDAQPQSPDSDTRGDAQTKNESARPTPQAQSVDPTNLNPGPSANANQTPAFAPTFEGAQPLTSASAAAAQASTAEAARVLPVHAQIGREIIRQFDGENTRFELRLDPPELGRVEIKLEVSRDHRVNAIVTADNPQALADLARSARELASALQSSGLELNDNGLSFNLSQKQSQSADQDADRHNSHQPTSTEIEPANTPTQRLTLESWRGGRIDLVA